MRREFEALSLGRMSLRIGNEGGDGYLQSCAEQKPVLRAGDFFNDCQRDS